MDSRVWREIGLWVVLPSVAISIVQMLAGEMIGYLLWSLWILSLFFSPLKDRVPRSARLMVKNYLFTTVGMAVVLLGGMIFLMFLFQAF